MFLIFLSYFLCTFLFLWQPQNTRVIYVITLDQCTGSRAGFGPQTLNPACQCTSGVGAFNCDKWRFREHLFTCRAALCSGEYSEQWIDWTNGRTEDCHDPLDNRIASYWSSEIHKTSEVFGKSSSVQPYETSPTIHSLFFKEASADTLFTLKACKYLSLAHVN